MPSPNDEYRRLEEALRESEARFRALFDQANDAIFMLHNGLFADCNAKGRQLFGRTRDQIIGHSLDEFSPPTQPDGRPSREKAAEIARKALAGEPQLFEWIASLPDGAALHTEISLNRLELVGKVYLQAILRDTTERKRAEKNLIRSLALLRATLDSTTDGILTIGPGRQILSFNEMFVKMWRIPAEILAASDDNIAIDWVINQLQAPEKFLAKIRHLYDHPLEESFDLLDFKDGRVFERCSRPMLVEGKPAGRVWSFRDISDRKHAEEQIAQQTELLDQARDAILVRSIEGNIIFWNKGAERVYGWTREEVAGRNVVEILRTTQQIVEEISASTINQGEWYGELQHVARDGRELILEVRCSLIRDNEGRPRAILSINTDITEKKRLESQFMRAQRMESVGTLAGGIAHDLNNILAPIMMSIEVLRQRTDDPQCKSILEAIAESSKRGADIVRQLLSFARGLEGDRLEVDPVELAKKTECIIKDTFPKNIRLELSLADACWKILGDPTLLNQVLLNLCLNARDAMPQGGRLGIMVENADLDSRFTEQQLEARPGRYVLISVVDSGSGIPSAAADKIFEPFFTTKEVGKGTGLGLSMVLAIVKRHGGFVNFESSPGHGTIFKVYLPAMEANQAARKRTGVLPSLPSGNGETVLIIDDEPSVLTVTSQTLEAFGYRTLVAQDGEEAVAVYTQHRDEITIVLTDMAMPGMDGTATIRALREINPAVGIIVASGSVTGGNMAKDAAVGIKSFLAKPYTAATLLKTLRTVLDEQAGSR